MNRRLHKSATDRKFGGVCSGIAETFGLDITLVRIAAFLLCVVYPASVIIYFVLALAMPVLNDGDAPQRGEKERIRIPRLRDSFSVKRAAAVSAVCTLAGVVIYRAVFSLPVGFTEVFDFALLALGAYIMTDGLVSEKTASNEKTAKIALGSVCAFMCFLSLSGIRTTYGFSFGYITSALRYLWPLLLCCAGVTLIAPRKKIAAGTWWVAVIIIILYSVGSALRMVF